MTETQQPKVPELVNLGLYVVGPSTTGARAAFYTVREFGRYVFETGYARALTLRTPEDTVERIQIEIQQIDSEMEMYGKSHNAVWKNNMQKSRDKCLTVLGNIKTEFAIP